MNKKKNDSQSISVRNSSFIQSEKNSGMRAKIPDNISNGGKNHNNNSIYKSKINPNKSINIDREQINASIEVQNKNNEIQEVDSEEDSQKEYEAYLEKMKHRFRSLIEEISESVINLETEKEEFEFRIKNSMMYLNYIFIYIYIYYYSLIFILTIFTIHIEL